MHHGAMPISTYASRAIFEPDQIKMMGAAFERPLTLLGLKDRADPLVEVIARLVIEPAQDGVSDSGSLAGHVSSEFREMPRSN
jgi:hypothetical protein